MLLTFRELVRHRFASKGAIDYRLFALVGLSILITSGLSATAQNEFKTVLWILLANLISISLLFAMILMLDFSLRRVVEDLQLSLGVLSIAGLILGATKGLATSWLLFTWGVEGDDGSILWLRAAFSAVIGAVTFPGIAMIGSLRYQFAEERKALLAEKMALERGASYPENLVSFVERAKEKLNMIGEETDQQAVAKELRDIINSDLRPLSQEIWLRESKKFPSFRLSQIAKVAVSRHVYAPEWVVPIWAITAVGTLSRFLDPNETLVSILLQSTVLLLGLLAAKRVKFENVRRATFVYGFSILLVGLIQLLIGGMISGERTLLDDLGLIIANLIWLFELTLFVGMAKAFIEMGRNVKSEAARFLNEADLEELKKSKERALVDRQLAQFLHGTMQRKLNMVAAKIESDTKQGNLENYLAEIEQVLGEAVAQFGQQPEQSIEEIIERLKRDWGGLVKLEFRLDAAALVGMQLETAREIMNEGISNSVRHGFASAVTVEVRQGPEILVEDDGIGPRRGPLGLGSAYFDSVAKEWELIGTGGGAVLRVALS